MAYTPTPFVDRAVQNPGRRLLTPVSGIANTYDVTRAEGTIFEVGTEIDADNLNAEFTKIKNEFDTFVNTVKGNETVLWSGSKGTTGTVSLSDSILNYKKIKLYGMSNSNQFETVVERDINDITINTSGNNRINISYFSNTTYWWHFNGHFNANNSFTIDSAEVSGFTSPAIYKIVGVK